ncbi:uncharacterized protein LOC131030144 isoform X1 [Cryptomeria japonica]|uniref:uncharacterized protein LOC131030144 isoform X1 n=1 Tax=Cryptomeria japonica TaxID=3369 RepID=UPI0027DA4C1F|nr:uncharacterized protein LOC131030144 isoform X1 [Cryptomeria japonica]
MESSQPNKRTRSDHGQKFEVFLSHSGKQKNFVRQLYRDLTNQGLLCFFDEDRESLPLGEDFPSRIFEAAETCRLAVLLLSKEFLQSRWPMLELSTLVKVTDKNPNFKIVPVFFMITPEALKQITADNENWKEFGISEATRVEWHDALKKIRQKNGLKFSEGGNEVEFRDKIMKEIWSKHPTASPRYHVPCMQGQLRMCKEVEDFFKNKVQPNEKGIRIAGLYGIAGQGKSTLGKAFCNHKLNDFEGKVCHLEFSRGDSFERTKLALRYLVHCPPSHLQDLTKDQAQVELHKRMKGQRVLLVLDAITEESKEEVRDFVKADFRENSFILLCARSVDVLVKYYKVHSRSCMHVPSLDKDDAVAILLESTSLEESKLGAKNKALALKCAKRGSLKELSCDTVRRGGTFHPLALKAFGSHLFGKYSSNLSKWVAEIDDLVDPSGYGLDTVFNLLDKAFHDMGPKYRTIFMLLTIYGPLNVSPHNVIEWLAISCNEEIEFIEKAVEDLCKKAFIEEFEHEIRIHDLYFEFAQCKAKEMGRWLWWKGDGRSTRGLISRDKAGFELVKLERCMYRIPSQIAPKFLKNLLVLQLVGVPNMRKLDLGGMDNLRSVTLHDCKGLAALDGMENLLNLAWLQIKGVDQMLKLPKLSSLLGLQHLEIDISVSQVLNQLGDFTACFHLRDINVRCPSLLEFPMLYGLPYLEKVEFSMCDKVKGPLDCTECVELQSIVLVGCCQMAASPLLGGCKKLSKIVLSECNAVTACPYMDVPSALKSLELQISSITGSVLKSLESCYGLENLQLWNMGKLEELPSFKSLSNLTVLKIGKCGIRDPPDLTCCDMLEDVYLFTLKNLTKFPNFTLLRKLKRLSLYNCSRVRGPPDISGCHQLKFFHLLYNDNMKGLPKMDECTQLEEIKVSWHCEDEVRYEGIDPDNCEVDDDLQSCLDCFKDVIVENLNDVSVPIELKQWMQGKTMLAKKYFRGVKLYYSVTVPYESNESTKCYRKNPITVTSVQSKVLVLPTLDRVNEDYGWLNRVREYIAGREIARASAVSGKKVRTGLSVAPSPRYLFKMWKTTVANAFNAFDFLNFDLRYFDRNVRHPKFHGGDALGRQKLALQYLIQFRNLQLEWASRENKALYFFNTTVEGQKVLLVLDNITENSIDEMRYYVGAELGENSRILLSARSVDVLKNFNIKSLQEEVAIVISIDGLTNGAGVLSKWAAKVDGLTDGGGDHPLKDDLEDRLGDHLDEVFAVLDIAFQNFAPLSPFRTYLYCLVKWFSERDLVDEVFVGLCWLAIKCRREIKSSSFPIGVKGKWSPTYEDVEVAAIKFQREIKYIKAKMSSDRVVKWLAINCRKAIKEKVEEMKHKSSIKELLQIIKDNYNEMACKTVEAISHLVKLSPRYHVPCMQGETRMCQKIVDLFNTNVHPNEKGISILGLYGMPGLGKTTLAKAFCNAYLWYFSGKVCLLQFCGGNALDRGKHALRYLTQFPTWKLESIKSKDNTHYIFNTLVKGQEVLLVLDNITEDSIDEVRHYLGAELGRKSCILLISRSLDVLKNFKIDSHSCMRAPSLEQEEAIAILLQKMYLKDPALGAEERSHVSKCANMCYFKGDTNSAPTFHPLALNVFGGHLFNKHGCLLSKWVDEIDGFANGARNDLDGMFVVVEKAFDDMDPRCRSIFMLLTRHTPHNMCYDKFVEWIALNCNEEISYIKEAVEGLRRNAFLEEIRPQIFIHDYIKEFAQTKYNNYCDEGESKFGDEIVRAISRLLPQRYHVPAMQGEARICQEVVDFFNTVHPNEKGIRIAGLYGVPGLGKTTLAKAFCNFNVANFNGNVYHVEFAPGGHSMDRQNLKLLTKSLQGQRVLVVLDNIQTEASIEYVKYFLQADLGENSWILLSARKINVLKNFKNVQPCMRIPGLEAGEAIAILLERTSLMEPALDANNRGFAMRCANRCSFKETSFHIVRGAHTFHPLGLKTYGRYLFSKYGSNLSRWVLELHGLDCMFTALDKAFDFMYPKYQTIFMLLTVYMPPNLPAHKVTQWLAVNCKEEINFIEKAVEDLWKKAFIEEIKPEIRIHYLYMDFAKIKIKKTGRWLHSEAKGGLFTEDEGGFELAKLEDCHLQDLSQIGDRYVKNLRALQVARNESRDLRLSSMKNIRSLTLHNCKHLEVLRGMENLQSLAWLQIVNVPNIKVLNLSSLTALQYLEINIDRLTEMGHLNGCLSLTEIYVGCPSLSEFPRIIGLPNLEKAMFKACEKVNGPLDCRACVKLQSIALENCWQMAQIPLIAGCSSLSRIVLNRCDRVTECSDEDESGALEIVKLCISSEEASAPRHSECCDGLKNNPLWNIVVSRDVPNLRRFTNLTVLRLCNCDICEPPDVACCRMLEVVCFSTLTDLESFPNFSSLRKLKRLCLYNCKRVRAPPDIGGCYSLQVFHLLYNDNMRGLPKLDCCQALERIKLSWQSEEVHYYSHSYEYDDLEFFPEYQKDGIFPNIDDVFMPADLKEWQWLEGKKVRVQQYFCGEKVYYSITAPCESSLGTQPQKQASIVDSLEQVIIQRARAVPGEDDLRFREHVMRAIGRLIPPRIRFPYSSMQNATTRIWLEKASAIKGIHVGGLYEGGGNGIITLSRSFYNFSSKGFENEVSTLEFSNGRNSIERLNNALQYLTCSPSLEMTPPTSEITEQGVYSKGPEFILMILLIRYPIPNKFMNDNLMHISRDFHRYWRGRTRIIVHSERYTIIELSRP